MRTFALVTVLGVWATVVLVRLIRTGETPDPITWGIPGGIWVLLHPRRQDPPQEPEPTPAVEPEGTT